MRATGVPWNGRPVVSHRNTAAAPVLAQRTGCRALRSARLLIQATAAQPTALLWRSPQRALHPTMKNLCPRGSTDSFTRTAPLARAAPVARSANWDGARESDTLGEDTPPAQDDDTTSKREDDSRREEPNGAAASTTPESSPEMTGSQVQMAKTGARKKPCRASFEEKDDAVTGVHCNHALSHHRHAGSVYR
jgi:hypothetical protein